MMMPKVFAISTRAVDRFRRAAGWDASPWLWGDWELEQIAKFQRALRRCEGGPWEVRVRLVPGTRQIHKLYVREPGGAWWHFEGRLASRRGRRYAPPTSCVLTGGLGIVAGLKAYPLDGAVWCAVRLMRDAAARSR